MEDLIQTITVYAIPVLLAITLHEAAHGYVARMFGDATAFIQGRISLNPLRHIDPVGTIVVPLALALMAVLAKGTPFFFGWAKPVPVNFGNLRHPKRDMVWVSAAGPGANLAMAIGWVLLARVLALAGVDEKFFYLVANAGVQVNLVFMALNLLPVPPLDGGRIAVGLLPHKLAWQWARLEPYGLFIVLGLLATGALGFFIEPFYRAGLAIVQLFI
jgi:Zn-dependent protease